MAKTMQNNGVAINMVFDNDFVGSLSIIYKYILHKIYYYCISENYIKIIKL
jgi:hypothetical protein